MAGGMANHPEPGVPDVLVGLPGHRRRRGDADAAVTANGGQVHVRAMAVGDLGTMAVVGDPGGAAIGIWQPGTHRASVWSPRPGPEPGSSCTPATTTPPSPSTATAFGWDTQPERHHDFRYTTPARATTRSPGSWTPPTSCPRACPSHWTVYFGVDDADAALAKTVELGASVVEPAEDTPYGRLAGLPTRRVSSSSWSADPGPHHPHERPAPAAPRRGGRPRPGSASRCPLLHLLEQPAVAVGIAERRVAAVVAALGRGPGPGPRRRSGTARPRRCHGRRGRPRRPRDPRRPGGGPGCCPAPRR